MTKKGTRLIFLFLLFRYSNVTLAQYQTATHLILIPLWAFYKLMAGNAINCQKHEEKLSRRIMVSTSGGCCSTLLLQMFSKIPNTMWVRWMYDGILHVRKMFLKRHFRLLTELLCVRSFTFPHIRRTNRVKSLGRNIARLSKILQIISWKAVKNTPTLFLKSMHFALLW